MIQIIINNIANKVRATLLTGLSTASNAAITATDTVLSAFGKLQAQITAISNSLSNYVTNSSLATTLSSYATTLQLADKQDKRIVVSSNTTAVIDGAYTLVASATFTDPTPVEGKGFSVLIRNGTATIGGTGYNTAGTTVWRVFHSGSWANYVNQLSIGYTPENVANKATTFATINDTLYPSVEAVIERYDCVQRTGTSIAFDRPANYGTIASPETGNITGDYTGARIGVQQLIIHNSGTAPTVPATWEQLITSAGYRISVVNYIYVEWISSNIATYTVSQKIV
jgi:hypothetical protein